MPKQRSRNEQDAVQRAVVAFRAGGRMLRMADALRAGIHRNTLYAMLASIFMSSTLDLVEGAKYRAVASAGIAADK